MLLSPRKSLYYLHKKRIPKNQPLQSIKYPDVKFPCISPTKIHDNFRKKSIDLLTKKFDTFKDKIEKQEVTHNKMHFNLTLIESQKCKIRHDQQLIQMKLKQIQNKLQQDCLQWEKISPRKRNVSRTQIIINNNQPSYTYLDEYNEISKNLNLQKSLQQTDHSLDQLKYPIDLLHCEEIKKRPKVLNYLKNRNSIHLDERTLLNNTQKYFETDKNKQQEDIISRDAETISNSNKDIIREISKTNHILQPKNSTSPVKLPKIHFQ